MSKTEVRYIPAKELRVSTGQDGTKTLEGYAIVFGVRSVNLGGFVEVVESRAVTETLSGAPDILLLNNHNTSQPLARTTSGTLKLSTDAVGVKFNCSLDTRSTYASDLAIAIERGDCGGCSFGFQTRKDSWTQVDGVPLRSLEKIDVSEISITSSPAYPQTVVDVRSCPSDLRKLLTRRSDEDDEDSDCPCDCAECLSGDCSSCSDPDCESEDCVHGDDAVRSVELWKLNTRLAIALKR